ncbi:MAG: rhomboid family intramembrane serine protease [Gemmataceae bacterium]|nr:rhomboid family intramembrane serine protease [Gemmataceae bacterium]MCI0741511.1 rhomboid family intramembrane serine protease [Gemmataceae bacterium]
MLIVGDEWKHNGKVPWVTFSLIFINVLVFLLQMALGRSFTVGFSLIPHEITKNVDLTRDERVKIRYPSARYHYSNGKSQTIYSETYVTVPQARGPFPIFLTLLTSMFMHGDWIHLIGNLWFLAVFGRNVECALDHGRFLLFYLGCGLVGGIAYTLSDMQSVIPCLGASGAISGIMGAYVAIFPMNMISLWFGVYFGVVQLPAIIVVGIWFLFQYLAAFASMNDGTLNTGGTAYWDHIGGFAAGVIGIWSIILFLKWRQSRQPPPEEDVEAPTVTKPEPNAPAEDPFRSCIPTTGPRPPGRITSRR